MAAGMPADDRQRQRRSIPQAPSTVAGCSAAHLHSSRFLMTKLSLRQGKGREEGGVAQPPEGVQAAGRRRAAAAAGRPQTLSRRPAPHPGL